MYLQASLDETTDQDDSSETNESYIDYWHLEAQGQMTLPFEDSEPQQ